MARKKTAKKVRRKIADYTITGNMVSAEDWEALWFDYDEENGVDMETLVHEPVVCFVSCHVGGQIEICGMVADTYGLEIAELDESFRGYVKRDEEGDIRKAVNRFIEDWLEEREPEDEDDDDDER